MVSDSNVRPDQTLQDVLDLVEAHGHSTIAVTDNGQPNGKLLGVVTSATIAYPAWKPRSSYPAS